MLCIKIGRIGLVLHGIHICGSCLGKRESRGFLEKKARRERREGWLAVGVGFQ